MSESFQHYPKGTVLVVIVNGDKSGQIIPLDEFITRNKFEDDYRTRLLEAVRVRGEFNDGDHKVRFVGVT